MPKNGLSRGKARELLRLLPGQAPPRMRPPRRSFTGTRSSSPAASRGPAKRTSTPPSSIQRVELLRRLGDIADVGEDHHRHALLEELGHRLRRRAALGEPHVGERPERAREIVGRGEQRLRGVGGRAGDDADAAPAPALVEQRTAPAERSALISRRAMSLRISTGSVSSASVSVSFSLKVKEASPSGRPLRSSPRTTPASAVPPAERSDLHRERAGGVVGGGERVRRRERRPRSR